MQRCIQPLHHESMAGQHVQQRLPVKVLPCLSCQSACHVPFLLGGSKKLPASAMYTLHEAPIYPTATRATCSPLSHMPSNHRVQMSHLLQPCSTSPASSLSNSSHTARHPSPRLSTWHMATSPTPNPAHNRAKPCFFLKSEPHHVSVFAFLIPSNVLSSS